MLLQCCIAAAVLLLLQCRCWLLFSAILSFHYAMTVFLHNNSCQPASRVSMVSYWFLLFFIECHWISRSCGFCCCCAPAPLWSCGFYWISIISVACQDSIESQWFLTEFPYHVHWFLLKLIDWSFFFDCSTAAMLLDCSNAAALVLQCYCIAAAVLLQSCAVAGCCSLRFHPFLAQC